MRQEDCLKLCKFKSNIIRFHILKKEEEAGRRRSRHGGAQL
jgi:hypothetical protein